MEFVRIFLAVAACVAVILSIIHVIEFFKTQEIEYLHRTISCVCVIIFACVMLLGFTRLNEKLEMNESEVQILETAESLEITDKTIYSNAFRSSYYIEVSYTEDDKVISKEIRVTESRYNQYRIGDVVNYADLK